jgi:hypothetical protein
VVQQRIAPGNWSSAWALEPAGDGPVPITSSRMSHLVDSLERAYRLLGFGGMADGDEVFRHLVLTRIIEPSSKVYGYPDPNFTASQTLTI